MAPEPTEPEVTADRLLDEYTELVPQLSASPYSRQLHRDHIRITSQLGLIDEREQAWELYQNYFTLDQEEWLEWIRQRESLVELNEDKDNLEPHLNLIELYKRAAPECSAIPLLYNYSKYFISNHLSSQGYSSAAVISEEEPTDEDEEEDAPMKSESEANPILEAAFGLEDVRVVRDEVLVYGGGNLAESQKLWSLWRRFETFLLKLEKTPEQIKQLDTFYVARLKVPHLGIEDTFSSYSSFVTKENNEKYSSLLPAANKVYAPALKKTEEREPMELKLKQANNADWAFAAYLDWELQVKQPDVALVSALFERATMEHQQNVKIWEMFVAFAYSLPKTKLPFLLETAEKAVKANPQAGTLWALYLQAIEKAGQNAETIEAVVARAIQTQLLDVDGLVDLYEARAGFHRREVDALITDPDMMEPDMIDPVVDILEEGIQAVLAVNKQGDPQQRLQKHLLRMFERFGRLEEASELWAKLVKANPRSYAAHYGYADFETRYGSAEKAHEIYKNGCSVKGLDYPEYLLEAWITFVKQNGTFDDMEYTIARVKKQKKGLEAKRAREAAAAGEVAVADVAAASTSVAVDSAETNGKKRERSPTLDEASKKAKLEPVPSATAPVAPVDSAEPKRDRENSTVIVIASSDAQVTEDNMKSLFRDCGAIRELKVKSLPSQTIAMIEFVDRESVLAAQTKDKKRINDVEVDVHIAWKSCLFVTNYPESYDKAAVETLFSKYGTIFDTRWPSKRFKTTRRFCYVQFTSPESADASLELNNTELETGLKLQVAISDPSARKGRTDAGANQKELYVTNLSRFVKEVDLERLFKPFGTLKGVRVVTDDKGDCKGFAFVEFEEESAAQASLALNNQELKKRRISVTIAQARVSGVQKSQTGDTKQTKQDKSVRVRGIKPGTEEAIVQQAFEKIAAVRLVIMVAGSTEATVELESAAEAGKVLMVKDSITIDDVPVEVSAFGRQARNADGNHPAKAAAEGEKLMPRQASRGRGRVGLGARGGRGRPGLGARPQAALASAASGSSRTPAASSGGRSQDDFRALLNKKPS
ncbi:hypothetical protein T439DRAFT_325059 [Meredithblackwellia eburnea MCA 4105]